MMKKEISYIICERYNYSPQSTLGRIYTKKYLSDRKYFSYSLEDTVRGYGIKVKGCTAIAENLSGYKLAKTHSNRFNRVTLQLYTEEYGLILNKGGISFNGIRNHGGNKHEDTEGCPLTAYNLLPKDKNFIIQGRSDKDLMDWYDKEITKGREVRWIVINLKQES